MVAHADVPDELVARLRAVCLGLPEAYEESAWVGTRWRVRKRTFGHVLPVESGWPPAYAEAANTDGPNIVLTFRLPLDELDAVVRSDVRFFRARWGRDVCGLVLAGDVDWVEVAELLTESYCQLAPNKLVAQVDRPRSDAG